MHAFRTLRLPTNHISESDPGTRGTQDQKSEAVQQKQRPYAAPHKAINALLISSRLSVYQS